MRTNQNDTSFQTWQAVADLVHHIKPLLTLHLGGVAQAMGVGPREAGVAVGLLRDDGFAFRREATQGLREGLQAIAISRAAGFDLAVVVLLADLLQSRVKSPLLADVWPEAVTRLRLWPDTVRAAVAQGLMRARDLGLAEIAPLAPARGITRGAKEIAEHLLQIIRSMRREELQAVAHVDQGREADRNHAKLLACIGQRNGIFLPEEGSYPCELVADDPQHPGHAGCTALLLLNVLERGDRQDGFGQRWQNQAAAYCALKPSQRDPILAALRHIHETDPDFLAGAAADFSPAGGTGRVIPVVDGL